MYRCLLIPVGGADCYYKSEVWSAQCPQCLRWGTLLHERDSSRPPAPAPAVRRYPTGSPAIDAILGGGLVKGGLYLLGGDPGAGKSTLLLQLAILFSQSRKTAYVTSEETVEMITDRALRLALPEDSAGLAIYGTAEIDLIVKGLNTHLFIDSLTMMQTGEIKSGMGSPNQAKACAHALMKYARDKNRTVVMVGQVTKDGGFAGPKMVEHLVDCLLYLDVLEPSDHVQEGAGEPRRLRVVTKNRYGAANGAFQMVMTETGLTTLSRDAGNETVAEKSPGA